MVDPMEHVVPPMPSPSATIARIGDISNDERAAAKRFEEIIPEQIGQGWTAYPIIGIGRRRNLRLHAKFISECFGIEYIAIKRVEVHSVWIPPTISNGNLREFQCKIVLKNHFETICKYHIVTCTSIFQMVVFLAKLRRIRFRESGQTMIGGMEGLQK